MFGPRYAAWSQISRFSAVPASNGGYYIYQIVGYDPLGRPVYQWVYVATPPNNWIVVKSGTDGGCTRPRQSINDYCYTVVIDNGVGYPPSYVNKCAHAQSKLDFGNVTTLNNWTQHSTLKAGIFTPELYDYDKLSKMDVTGFSGANLSGVFDIDSLNRLQIGNIKGSLSIASGSNFQSFLKVLVLKESRKLSANEEEEIKKEENLLLFRNVLLEGTITLKSSGIEKSGLFSDAVVTLGRNDTATIANLDGINKSLQLNKQQYGLNEDEEFSIVVYVDGGFDYPIKNRTGARGVNNSTIQENVLGTEKATVYPNPANNMLSISLPSSYVNANVTVTLMDITGRTVQTLYNGDIQSTILPAISVKDVANGFYFVNITANGERKESIRISINR